MNESAPLIRYNLSKEDSEILNLRSEETSEEILDQMDVRIGEELGYNEFSTRSHGLNTSENPELCNSYELLHEYVDEYPEEALNSEYVDNQRAASKIQDKRKHVFNQEEFECLIADIFKQEDYNLTEFFDKLAFQRDLQIKFVDSYDVEVDEE